MPRPHRPAAIAVAGLLAIALAACGQAGQAPTAAAPSIAASNQPPVATAPATAAAATPAVTAAPLQALPTAWEATGKPAISDAGAGTYSPAIDPLTGDIWVAVSPANVIWIFSKDGTFRSALGKSGTGDLEFNFQRSACPHCPGAGGIAFAPDGTVFISDVGNHRIQKLDPKHAFVKAWGTFGAGDGQFADALQVATNGHEVFVSDDTRLDIQVFDLDGTYLRTIPAAGWLTVDPTGNVIASSNNWAVTVYDPAGSKVASYQLPRYHGAEHIGLALDASGRLFFDYQDDGTTNAVALGAFDPKTGASQIWASAGETLAIGNGMLYEANYRSAGWSGALLRAYAVPAP